MVNIISGMISLVCFLKSRDLDQWAQQIDCDWETGAYVCFRRLFLLQQSAWCCQPCCTLMVLLVGLSVRAAEVLTPLQGVSSHSLTSSLCCCCPVGHQCTQSPDWATVAWPCSILPTALITSQMVIDEALLAALTPLKDSQTYIRGPTDWFGVPSFKGWTSQAAGGPIC